MSLLVTKQKSKQNFMKTACHRVIEEAVGTGVEYYHSKVYFHNSVESILILEVVD